MRDVVAPTLWASCLVGPLAAACVPQAPPPQGEALVVIDTDAPSPAFVGRMRIDLYAPDGTWVESRDVAAQTNHDWPAAHASQGAYGILQGLAQTLELAFCSERRMFHHGLLEAGR